MGTVPAGDAAASAANLRKIADELHLECLRLRIVVIKYRRSYPALSRRAKTRLWEQAAKARSYREAADQIDPTTNTHQE